MLYPRILFPANPFEPRKPDFDFEVEYQTAREAGFEVGILDTDRGELGRVYPPGPVLYRGWMVSADRYAELDSVLRQHELELVISPASYRFSHHLPGWYSTLAGHTPPSVWFPDAEGWSPEAVVSALGVGPFVVKDYVKSAKHYWHEACFIPDQQALTGVAQRFLELRGEDLEGGLVFRRFLPFASIGHHPKSGMPLTLEFRAFYWKTERIGSNPYWEVGDYSEVEPPWDDFAPLLKSVASPFFALDMARDESGRWWVVELGDGQVSGLPPGLSPAKFYEELANGIINS